MFSCIGSSCDLQPPPAAPALGAAQNAQTEALDYKASAPAAPAGLDMVLQNSGARNTGDRKRAAHDDDDVVDPKRKLQSFHNRDGVDKGQPLCEDASPSRASSLGSSHGPSAIGGTNIETISPFSRTRTVPRFFTPCVCTLAACVCVCVCLWVCWVCACVCKIERDTESARAPARERAKHKVIHACTLVRLIFRVLWKSEHTAREKCIIERQFEIAEF